MGTKAGLRTKPKHLDASLLVNEGGDIAQVLHPVWIKRDDPSQAADILVQIDHLLSAHAPQTGLVLTGGGFLEVWLDDRRPPLYWRSENALVSLADRCRALVAPVLLHLQDAPRDYLLGIDFMSQDHGVGQFAALGRAGRLIALAWKSFPVGAEGNWLAGFGTEKGRSCPRVAPTAVGNAVLLVCHDAQAFNHRNIALVRRAMKPTDRFRVMDTMSRQMYEARPTWALNLIHVISKPASITTFHKSFKQIATEHPWHPKAVGAFGYDQGVRPQLSSLADKCQYPAHSSKCVIVIEE